MMFYAVIKCHECGAKFHFYRDSRANSCPNCGARLRTHRKIDNVLHELDEIDRNHRTHAEDYGGPRFDMDIKRF